MRGAFVAIGASLALLAASVLAAPANRLAKETSPYLLLHAHNPVDWYPWGPEALARAKKEDRPIFLSIGYSTCYWCHMMERDIFSDEKIARLMNDWFVCIKVDREERPDLDDAYMLATQVLTGGGGWPNSVFLTPELEPFYAGTYFAPVAQGKRPAFPDVLRHLHEGWTEHRKEVLEQAKKVVTLMKASRASTSQTTAALPGPEHLERVVDELARAFDDEYGGFGDAPKFPSPSTLHALAEARDNPKAQKMLVSTLEHMARGGIFDQLGGGFHRYSTDRMWLVPHFEKMLYDNAFLAPLLARAANGPDLRRAARETLEFVLRELTGPSGEFWSALGAGKAGEEGAYYVWTRSEIDQVLGASEATALAPVLGIDGGPSFEGGRFVLHLPRPLEEAAAAQKVPLDALVERLKRACGKLLAARIRRPRPLTDTKALTDGNGMMIRAMALASRDLGEPRFLAAAERAANLALSGVAKAGTTCKHSWVDGKMSVDAFLDDYAFLAGGLLALAEVTGQKRWTEEARRLVSEADARLWNERAGRYEFAPANAELPSQSHDWVDLATPSGNSWMARVLVELAEKTRDEAYLARAEKLLRSFASQMAESPPALCDMAVALARYHEARKNAGPVTASIQKGALSAKAGQTIEVPLEIVVAPGWHISSGNPLQPFLEPTKISLAPGSPARLGKLALPPGRTLRLGFNKAEQVSVYEGKVEIRLPIEIAADAKPGPIEVALEIRAQPCNDEVCRAPVTLRVTAQVTIIRSP